MGLFKSKQKEVEPLSQIDKELESLKLQIDQTNLDYESVPSEAKAHNPKGGTVVKVKNKYFPERTFLINMQLRNGDHTQFVLNTKENFFDYLGGQYILDETLKYYVISARKYCFDFHQDFCLPVRRHIDVKQLNETMEVSGMNDCGASSNPSTLSQSVKANIAEGIMKAQEIDEFFKSIKFIVIVTCIASVLTFLLLLQTSGALKGLSL